MATDHRVGVLTATLAYSSRASRDLQICFLQTVPCEPKTPELSESLKSSFEGALNAEECHSNQVGCAHVDNGFVPGSGP